MTLTEEQLSDLTEHAGNLMKRSEICIIMGIDLNEFNDELENPESLVYEAYHRGILLTKEGVRKSVITLAKSGSSPAQTMAEKFLREVDSEKYE